MQDAQCAQPHAGAAGRALSARGGVNRYADTEAFVDSWDAALGRADHRGSHLGILLIGVDGLDDVHNLPGIPMRNRTLHAAAAALCECTRTEDIPAHIGADGFALAVCYWEPADLLHLAHRVRATFQLTCESFGIGCTMSMGIAGSGQLPVEQLMEIADRALERSRQSGGNCVELGGARRQPPTQS